MSDEEEEPLTVRGGETTGCGRSRHKTRVTKHESQRISDARLMHLCNCTDISYLEFPERYRATDVFVNVLAMYSLSGRRCSSHRPFCVGVRPMMSV